MKKEKLEDYAEREELVRQGFEERKLPINHFYKNENGNMIVYFLFKDSTYKRARNIL